MTVDHIDGVALRDVPDNDEVVVAGAQQNVFGSRVPFQGHHASSEKRENFNDLKSVKKGETTISEIDF